MDPVLGLAIAPITLIAIAGLVRAARGTAHPDEEPER
jgi:hypothetical protein